MNLVRLMENQKKDKFNWKVVVIALVIIITAYLVISAAITESKRETVYCYFNISLYDDVPRDECGIFKVVSMDIGQIGIEEFRRFGVCSDSLSDLPGCDGEKYLFSKYKLKDFCKDPGCKADGVICSAFFVRYHNESDFRNVYEESFTESDISSEELLMEKIDKCK